MSKINKEEPSNMEFWCDEFQNFSTYNRCIKNCWKKDKIQCAEKRLFGEIYENQEIEEIRSMEKERCPKCGSYLVSSLYFAFCPQCGLSDDEE